ncbi:E1 ubiquitin-activating protein uba2 [Ceratocystis pirilliformis]|uniref:E1 ubiquitin-activating protein uba2 n=1 Tax=Ceratocystis pirilliformis TaxID=259994 RepID=A0ABR3ZDF3_9PEZI
MAAVHAIAPETSTIDAASHSMAISSLQRDIHIKKALGSRVLMVGAGGIGCELLKNLVLTGFADIHIVDLDTIDLSNLNRQFLFRHEHIKKSKALVAKEVAQRFNPNTRITAYHANIKDSEFGIKWFRQFTLVFNALDNLDARRHVNKMCLAANIPLIESGTTGFNGQVQVIKKGVTACYDCTPKETPKTFPVCTIRSTPSQPIHCIVWAKSYLLNEIFGESEDESAFDHSQDAENSAEIEELRKESTALKAIRNSIGKLEFSKMLFTKVFDTDIQRLLSMQDMWKGKRSPVALSFEECYQKMDVSTTDEVLKRGQDVWSVQENLAVFMDSLERLGNRILNIQADKTNEKPCITFDKDDEDTLDFVASAANLRAHIFGIATKSRFDIKQMAGNIIPAIATTNAISAGLSVIQALKVLQGHFDQIKEVYLTPFAPNRLLAPDKSRKPNPECPVCSPFQVVISVDLNVATLSDLVNGFLRSNMGYGSKDIVVSNDVGPLYDADEDQNLDKKLTELGINPDSFLTIIDEDDDETFVNVTLNIQEAEDGQVHPITIIGDSIPVVPLKPESVVPAANDNDDDGLVIQEAGPSGLKRPHEDDLAETIEAKKAKTRIEAATETDAPVSAAGDIQVLDEDDGVILIED